ncbi:hypothetical protein [Bifidobacterium parmae]|uniref:Colicin transporter n=1 Tax=Bifidobacterium parmae TaxID=361854 RepID=A0A2N5IWL9_9BIFI|nr:hypothetical protein [Bifidobacterium parmae]PLS26348.1 colicin transporter [Bifidobacterium parmae]
MAANGYAALVNGRAADASKIKTTDVKDAKTVDALAKTLKAGTPRYMGCVADDKAGLEAATAKLDGQADWYQAHGKSLTKAVAAVESSKLDKTVDAANALYKSSDGKVADGKTRDELAKAIKARDADAIGRASAAVNASVKAKSDADAQAQADAQTQQAAGQASAGGQAAGGQAYANTGYSGGGYTGGGYSYSNGGYSGGYSYSGGGATAPSTPNNGGGNSGSGGGYTTWGDAEIENGGIGCTTSKDKPECSGGIEWWD